MTRELLMKVAVALALIVIVLVVVGGTRPSEFRVVRSATIAAPPAAVFAQVNGFHNWPMGWRFPWVSSQGGDFNFDFNVSFTKAEMAKGAVDVSQRGRSRRQRVLQGRARSGLSHVLGLRPRPHLLVGAYNYLDLAPRGRDEDALPYTMAWVRHHDRY